MRVIAVILSKEADDDFDDEVMKKVFGPERVVAPVESDSE